jgi:DNA-binding transcriptional MerR regulator
MPHTTREVARRLSIHPSRVRRLAERYGIGTKTDGGYLLFTDRDVDKLRARSTGKSGRPKVERVD